MNNIIDNIIIHIIIMNLIIHIKIMIIILLGIIEGNMIGIIMVEDMGDIMERVVIIIIR